MKKTKKTPWDVRICFLFKTSKVTLVLLVFLLLGQNSRGSNRKRKDVFRLEVSKVSPMSAGPNAVGCGEHNMAVGKHGRAKQPGRKAA